MNNNGRVYWPHLNQDAGDNPILTLGRQCGKTETTDALMNEVADRSWPIFTWTEIYPSFRDTFHYLIHGYYAEAKPPGERWMGDFALRYYGYEARDLWDHREWLGDDTLHHTEFLSPHEWYKRGVLRVIIPARRYAGLHAYELQSLFYLKQPKPGDWSQEVFRHETEAQYYRHRDGAVIYLEPHLSGATTFSYTVRGGDIRFVNPYEERASERRAKHSSTMDKNGKPRRR